MKSLEIERTNVEEAIADGLSEMGLSLEEVSIDVLDEGNKGLFGLFGARPARVRLVVREPETQDSTIFAAARPTPAAAPRPAPAARPVVTSPPPVRPQPQAKPAPVAAAPAALKTPAPAQSTQAEPAVPVEPGRAAEFVSEVARLMQVDVTVESSMVGGTLRLDIQGDEKGILIGHRGETLDSLQYLTSLVHNKDTSEFQRIQLDSQNYRKKREETLIRLAHRLAEKARRSRRKVTLEPMNPYERRIMHSALQGNAYVTTHSEGDEPNRRVVIMPK